MSSQKEHEEKAKHDAKLYNSLDSTKFPDWAVVVQFYKCVHLIEGILSKREIHTSNHEERKSCMLDSPELFVKDVKIGYRELESLSRQARYMPEIVITDEKINKAQSCVDEIESWYNIHKND